MMGRGTAVPAADEATHAEHSAPPSDVQAAGGAGESLDERISRLRKLLKPKSGPAPTSEAVAVALELARAFPNADAVKRLPAGGARTRALKLRDRIRGEGLLAAEHSAIATPLASAPPALVREPKMNLQPLAASAPAVACGAFSFFRPLQAELFVSDAWIRASTPGIRCLLVSEPVYDAARPSVATRTLTAHVEDLDSGSLSDDEDVPKLPRSSFQLEYDLEPFGESRADAAKRADRNRCREKAVLRKMDVIADVEHRTKQSKQRQEARALEAAVAEVVDALVDEVERVETAWDPAEPKPGMAVGDWIWTAPPELQLARIDARYKCRVLVL